MTTKPRLLCLMQLPPPIHGASVVNQRIAESTWLASKFSVDVLALRFTDSIQDIRRISMRKLYRAATTGVRLAGSLLTRRPAAVYFTLAPAGSAFYRDCAYIAIIKAFGIPRIYHLHGKGVRQHLDVPWKRSLYAWAFRGASVIHLSPMLASDLGDVISAGQLQFVANGIPDDTGARAVARAPGPPRILFLSTMARDKGPLVLLDALARLTEQGVAFEATFAGPDFEDGTIAELARGIAEKSMGDRVRYVGPAYGRAKEELFRSHDIFAFPTSNDAFPLVVLEAMQHHLPVVSSLEGAIPDMVEEGRSGFLVAKRDPEALAARLALLLADPALRARMGERGRARYAEQFTIGHFERNLGEVLIQMIEAADG